MDRARDRVRVQVDRAGVQVDWARLQVGRTRVQVDRVRVQVDRAGVEIGRVRRELWLGYGPTGPGKNKVNSPDLRIPLESIGSNYS